MVIFEKVGFGGFGGGVGGFLGWVIGVGVVRGV